MRQVCIGMSLLVSCVTANLTDSRCTHLEGIQGKTLFKYNCYYMSDLCNKSVSIFFYCTFEQQIYDCTLTVVLLFRA